MNTRTFLQSAIAIAATMALLKTPVWADPARALDSIDSRLISQAAEDAVRAQVGPNQASLSLTPAPLDPRLRLPVCDRPLEAFITDNGQIRYQTTLGVRCVGTVRWTIYTSITVESLAPVLVARYALPRDAALTTADFQLQTRRVPGTISGYITDPAALAGQRLQRPLTAGEALGTNALAPAFLIHRGQQVVLLAQTGGIEVRMAGVALSDARVSDRIRVQNLSSQRIVEGIVRSDSVVEMPL